MIKKKSNPHLLWGALFLVTVVVPVVFCGFTLNFLFNNQVRSETHAISNFADQAAHNLSRAINNRQFWCFELNRVFAASQSAEELDQALKTLSESYHQKMAWVIWEDSGHVFKNSFADKHNYKIWKRLGKILRKSARSWFLSISTADDMFVRRILGPHLQTKILPRSSNLTAPDLIELSYRNQGNSMWVDFNQLHGAMVLLPPGIELKKQGLRHFCSLFNEAESPFHVSIAVKDDFFSTDGSISRKHLSALKNSFKFSENNTQQLNGRLYSARSLENDAFLCISGKQRVQPLRPLQAVSLLAVLLLFAFVVTTKSVSLTEFSANFSIRYTVTGLILFSNIFPLLIIAVSSHQYLQQKRQLLIEGQRIEAISCLRSIETEFTADTHRVKNSIMSRLDALSGKLKTEPLSLQNSRDFLNAMGPLAGNFMIIASNTFPFLSNSVYLNKKQRVDFKKNDSNNFDTITLNETMGKLGSAFISYYNDTALSDKTITEAELIIEAVFQDKLTSTFHRFLGLLDRVENLGMGSTRNPTFMHLLSLGEDRRGDYLFLFHFLLEVSARDFLARKRTFLKANPQGLKVIYSPENNLDKAMLKPFKNGQHLKELLSRTTHFPPPFPEFVTINGELWLAAGFQSKILANYRLVALAPVKNIDRIVADEGQNLLILLFINILLVGGIALVFVQMLLRPIELLQSGTEAISRKNFDFRIPALGKDEFGKMSQLFNSALEDLEELSMARDVQQQLFPHEAIDTGNFDLYGRTIPLTELGGDYLDYFEVDSGRFAMVLGDVAGHGVGAAMIMAMAKAAVLNSKSVLSEPRLLIERLHELIYRTKSKKQKKIMTFQYFCVEKGGDSLTFSNAGGCNPIIIRADRMTTEEVMLPGPVLGSFKKAVFQETRISLNPGDAVVIYTDGISEARNDAGEEPGLPGLQKMLLSNFCSDSRLLYQRIISACDEWRQNQPRQDDISMMVLIRKA